MFKVPRTTARILTVIGVTAGTLAAAPSAAIAASCPTLPSSQPFAQWGDTARYSLAAGGDFEKSISWASTGSPVLSSQNDPFALSGPGLSSVRVRGAQTVTSGVICVSALHPTMRFVARALDPTSRLVLEVLWSDAGVAKVDVLEEHPADLWRLWAPSKIVPLGDKLPSGIGETHQVRLRFKLKNRVGDWLIDDVFVDPRASR